MPLCTFCHTKPVTPPRRKFCSAACAREGVREWKRKMRSTLRAEWDAGLTAEPPWKDGWNDDEERKRYHREYMRERRLVLRLERQGHSDFASSRPPGVSRADVGTSISYVVSTRSSDAPRMWEGVRTMHD